MQAVSFHGPRLDPAAAPIFDGLLQSLLSRRCVRLRYYTTDGPDDCDQTNHRAVQIFALYDVSKIELLEDTFSPPPALFDVSVAGKWIGLEPRIATRRHVVIRFAPAVARRVAVMLWHPTQQTVFDADGSRPRSTAWTKSPIGF